MDATVMLTGVSATAVCGSLGLSAERYDLATGNVEHSLKRPLRIGEDNEPQVSQVLAAHLDSVIGGPIDIEEASNERGEDFALRFRDGRSQAVQVTLAVTDPDLWRALAKAGATIHAGTPATLAAEMRCAIERKGSGIEPKARSSLWLALDAQFTPGLARPSTVGAYLSQYGNPCAEFGFAQVWVVGPTPDTCVCICRAA